jgi:hypothetical protein
MQVIPLLAMTLALAVSWCKLSAQEPDNSDPADYELRIMTAKPGKLAALHDWFRAHQEDVLAKHGVEGMAYLVPAAGDPEDKLIAILRFRDYPAKIRFLRAVGDNALWKQVADPESGPDALVAKVEDISLRRLQFSPKFEPTQQAEPRVFELRTYTCPSEPMLARLHDRFREHTMKLFEKHGMENLVYWRVTTGDDGERMLIYLLGHKSVEAAKESFAAFRSDPEWLAAKKASEELSGGSLTKAENGVQSQFLSATDYSPLK